MGLNCCSFLGYDECAVCMLTGTTCRGFRASRNGKVFRPAIITVEDVGGTLDPDPEDTRSYYDSEGDRIPDLVPATPPTRVRVRFGTPLVDALGGGEPEPLPPYSAPSDWRLPEPLP